MRLLSDNTDRTIYCTNIRNTWTKQGAECCGRIKKEVLSLPHRKSDNADYINRFPSHR
jgi:hypothetical protein